MPDIHRSQASSERYAGARATLAAVLQQQLIQRQLIQRQLTQRHPHLWPRFLAIYAQLQRLPRRWRRRLVRKAAVSLAGVALLLALGRTPTLHAANITVDDGRVTIAYDNYCSLPEAIISANDDAAPYGGDGECEPGTPGVDTIHLPDYGTFTLTGAHDYYNYSDTGLPRITSAITIVGNGATIERDSDDFRLLAISDTGNLTINNVTLSGGRSSLHGGAIYNDGGTLTITDSTLSGNVAQGDGDGDDDNGGAIFNRNGEVTVSHSSFSYNEADYGGAIYNNNVGEVNIYYSTFSYNSAYFEGGAIYNYYELTIHNSTFSDNEAFQGGAIYNQDDLWIYNSTFSYNGADYGGAIYNEDDLWIYNSTFSGNESDRDGGAIYNDGELTIYNSTFSGNESDEAGGGAIYNDGELTIYNSTFSGNYAKDDGGAIRNHDDLYIYNSTFSGNEAEGDGGAIYNSDNLNIYNSTFSGNEARYDGGAIINEYNLHIYNSTFSGNTAEDGGAIYNDGGSVSLHRTLISGNEATDDGDEIFNDGIINADDYNLFGHGGIDDDAAFIDFTPDLNDINATSDGDGIDLEDILAPALDDNGGPLAGAPGIEEPMLTLALVSGSPAIDAAPSADCNDFPINERDQRGFLRNVDGRGDGNLEDKECDIGAYEFQPLAIYMTAAGPGITSDGVAFGQEDILLWQGGEWSKHFDGTDAGLTTKHDINAIHVNGEDDIYLSFFQNKIKTANLGKVFGHDIIHYDGSSFSLFFDGSDVGLTTTAEKIDALHILDGSLSPFDGCDHYLLISTLGTGKVPAAGGGNLKFQGEDVLGFCLTNSGENTAGFWNMVMDGSAEGMPKNSTDSISANEDGSVVYLTTQGVFNVDGAFGGHSMVYKFENGDFSGPHFSAPANGLNAKVDGLHSEGGLP